MTVTFWLAICTTPMLGKEVPVRRWSNNVMQHLHQSIRWSTLPESRRIKGTFPDWDLDIHRRIVKLKGRSVMLGGLIIDMLEIDRYLGLWSGYSETLEGERSYIFVNFCTIKKAYPIKCPRPSSWSVLKTPQGEESIDFPWGYLVKFTLTWIPRLLDVPDFPLPSFSLYCVYSMYSGKRKQINESARPIFRHRLT